MAHNLADYQLELLEQLIHSLRDSKGFPKILDKLSEVVQIELNSHAFAIYSYQTPDELSFLDGRGAGSECFGISGLNKALAEEEATLKSNSGVITNSICPFCDPRNKQSYWTGIPLVMTDTLIGYLILFHSEKLEMNQKFFIQLEVLATYASVTIILVNLGKLLSLISMATERQRQASLLHDSVSQLFYSIGLGAKSAQQALKEAPDKLPAAISHIEKLAEYGQLDSRALAYELQMEILSNEGLIESLTRQIDILEINNEIEVQADLCEEPMLSLEGKEAVYRVVQESFQNIIKHSQATKVEVNLYKTADRLILRIRDNGIGFDVKQAESGGRGIVKLRKQVEACGGEIFFRGGEGTGAEVLAHLPFYAG